MQNFRGCEGLFSFLFCKLRGLSFSVDLLSIVSALSYCMYCKECENILKYFEVKVH